MTDRIDELSDRARWFLEQFDEIDLADICASSEAVSQRAEGELCRVRDAAYLHRKGLIGSAELHAVIDTAITVTAIQPAPAATQATDEPVCGAEPPTRADDPNTQWGDCWCTLPPGHDGEHRCQPCTDRHGAPGWPDHPAAAEPHTGLVVQPYRERGEQKWVFRCWGMDDGCDGLLSLDHYSEQSAERARDRHVAEEHAAAPSPITDTEGRTICTCTIDTPCGCGTSVHYQPKEQP